MFRAAASFLNLTPGSALWRVGAVSAACVALTLSGCGGGSRAKDYYPDRVVSFGDENSLLESYSSTAMDAGSATKTIQGLAYTVNPVVRAVSYCTDMTVDNTCASPVTVSDPSTFVAGGSTVARYYDASNYNSAAGSSVYFITTGTANYAAVTAGAVKKLESRVYSCASSTIWVQVVAHAFDKGFTSKCALDQLGGAETYAAYGAKVADLQAQIAAHRGELGEGVLVTIMVGQHDILEQYERTRLDATQDASARQTLASRGTQLAAIIRDVLSTGAKVVFALTPDLGQSPKAKAEDQALLSAYTKIFNDRAKLDLGTATSQDGRHLALVETDLFTNPTTRSSSYNYDTALCDPAQVVKPDAVSAGITAFNDPYTDVKYCTSASIVSGGSTSTYIWADTIHFAPAGHSMLGLLAAQRAANQF
jgi:hypothetical protein